MKVHISVNHLAYTSQQYDSWKAGVRDGCHDPYCKNLPHTYGFGENLVGNYFESIGYKWIHHDYCIFGACKSGKYPIADEVLIKCFGEKELLSARTIYRAFKNIEEPDLLIYRPDFSEIRFAEAKRTDTRDKLRDSQIRGLALLNLLFGSKVEVFEITRQDKESKTEQIIWEF